MRDYNDKDYKDYDDFYEDYENDPDKALDDYNDGEYDG